MDQNQHQISNNLVLSQTVENCHSSSSSRPCCPTLSESGNAALKSLSREVFGVGIKLQRYGKKILRTLLVSRFHKHFNIFRIKGNQAIQEQISPPSSSFDMMSTKSIVKIWRKHYKVSGSKKGQKFQTESQNVHLENLKPHCLCEVVAFHMNVEEKKGKMKALYGLFGECKLQISEGKSSLSISASDSSRDIEVDLTCSICLDTVFDPVALKCGHVFCYMCACSAGSILTLHGMKAANSTSKCPLCRKEGVFQDAERMSQLHILLKRKLPEYWKERREKERQARVKEAKQYWELQCRAFIGIK